MSNPLRHELPCGYCEKQATGKARLDVFSKKPSYALTCGEYPCPSVDVPLTEADLELRVPCPECAEIVKVDPSGPLATKSRLRDHYVHQEHDPDTRAYLCSASGRDYPFEDES